MPVCQHQFIDDGARGAYQVGVLTRGLGSSDGTSPAFLSYLLFESVYIERLLELGYHDAYVYAEEIKRFLAPS